MKVAEDEDNYSVAPVNSESSIKRIKILVIKATLVDVIAGKAIYSYLSPLSFYYKVDCIKC